MHVPIYYLLANSWHNFRMQYHDVSKTPRRYNVQFVDPLKVAQASFTYKITVEDKKNLSKEEQLSKQKEKEAEIKNKLVDYLTKVFLNSQDKDCILRPYNFA